MNTNDKTLADVQPGDAVAREYVTAIGRALRAAYRHLDMGSLRVSHCNDAAIIEAALKDVDTFDLNAAIAALFANPSPGGQNAREREGWRKMQKAAASQTRKDGAGACDALYELAVKHGANDAEAAGLAHHVNGSLAMLETQTHDGVHREATMEVALAARQPVGKHGEGDEFLSGICVALQCVTAQDSGVLWAEIVRAVGVDDLLQYATFIEPEEWDLAGFDLMIAHPPCTHLSVSGARHFEAKRMDGRQQSAVSFFMMLAKVDIPMIAIEKPVCIMSSMWRQPDQVIQPWQFGHGETKATALWLKGLPRLTPTNIVEGREDRIHRMAPGPDRWKERSKTYPGIAAAMADQ